MVIRLRTKKLCKARAIAPAAANQNSHSLLELQALTGYLNFASIVTPLGRTFLRRLYNMQIYFPIRGPKCRRHLSTDARKDLLWWKKILKAGPERSLQQEHRDTVYPWSDPSGTTGLRAYYYDTRNSSHHGPCSTGTEQPHSSPQSGSAFSIALPRYLARANEHINTKELHALEQALLYWGDQWRGTKVLMHIDNRAVMYELENLTIRGNSMDVLRRCLLLAAYFDLEIEPRWIPTNENGLADALSRFDYNRITNLPVAPQLVYPTCSLRACGFLTCNKLDSLR